MSDSNPKNKLLPVQSAAAGDAKEQFERAMVFEQNQNFDLAAAWYKNAALNGHAEAAFRAGMLCLKQCTITKTESYMGKDAIFWFQKAAQDLHAEAEFQISLLYEDGIGVSKDPELALRWLKLAVEHGSKEATDKLRLTNRNLSHINGNKPVDDNNRNTSSA